jgi:hypothetical protein
MGKFEDSLWTELQREHGQALLQNMAKRQSRRARRWVGIAAAVTVLGTGALVASTYFGGAPPAYAVVDNPDGSVTLTVREVQRFEEATAKLRERGIPAAALPLRENCPAGGRKLDSPQALGSVEFQSAPGKIEIKILRDRIPADATVVLAAEHDEQNGTWTVAGGVYERDQLPSCLPLHQR